MTFRLNAARYPSILKISNSPNGSTLTIPPRCEVIRQFKVNAIGDCVIDQITLAPGVYTSRTIVNTENAFIRVVNTTDNPQRVSNVITAVEPLENFACYNADDRNMERSEKLNRILSKNVPKYSICVTNFRMSSRYPETE